MWEIYSDGEDPYSNMALNEVSLKVCMGMRLQQPKEMPNGVGEIMSKYCFAAMPKKRMSMGVVSWDCNSRRNKY